MRYESHERYELLKKLADDGDRCAQRSLARVYFEGKINGRRQESPEGRGLKRVSAALQFLKRAISLSCDLRLAATRFRLRRGRKQLIKALLSQHAITHD